MRLGMVFCATKKEGKFQLIDKFYSIIITHFHFYKLWVYILSPSNQFKIKLYLTAQI